LAYQGRYHDNGSTLEGRREHPRQGTRVKARQEKSAAIVARLFDLWETELPRLSGKSKLAEAIRYAISGGPLSNAS
jgi:Transposase IS66 family